MEDAFPLQILAFVRLAGARELRAQEQKMRVENQAADEQAGEEARRETQRAPRCLGSFRAVGVGWRDAKVAEAVFKGGVQR